MTSGRFFLLLMALLALSMPARSLAAASSEPVYEAAAGRARIVLTFTESDGNLFGRYFYRSTRKDIDLSGRSDGGTLSFASEVTGDRLVLTRTGAKLVGTLTSATSRRLDVSLHPVGEPSALPPDMPPGLDLYERWRLAGLSFTAGQAEAIDGKTIRWYDERLTGLKLFRLESGYSAPAMAAINRALARNQWTQVSNWLQCTSYGGGPGMDASEADKPWLGATYVSYIWHASWSCAGTAHPDFSTVGHSYDARSGRELALDDVLRFGAAPVPPSDSSDWDDYRSGAFASGVVALMRKYHPEAMKPPAPGAEDDCDYSDQEVWNYPGWALSKDGLWLGAIFARAMRACDSPEWAVVPWRALSLPPDDHR